MSLLLDYNSVKASYTGMIYGPVSGIYRIIARSRAGDTSLDIPLTILASQPTILSIIDAAGNSALQGQALQLDTAIAVAWKEVQGATAYRLQIQGAGGTAYQSISHETAAAIPAGTCIAGTYTIVIEAQAIAGDSLLLDAPYYAASAASSASVVFQIHP